MVGWCNCIKSFFFSIFSLLFFNFLGAQSSGGASLDRKLERLSDKFERLGDRVAATAESKAVLWEGRAEQIGERAERFGEQMEDKWDKDWSVRLGGLGRKIAFATCPEVAVTRKRRVTLPPPWTDITTT